MRTFKVRQSAFASFLLVALAYAPLAVAGEPSPGEALYQARCASCHANPGTKKAPSLETMRQMSGDRVFFSLSNGIMKSQAAGLSFLEMGALMEYASAGARPEYSPAPASMCSKREVDTQPAVQGWGFDDRSTRSLGADRTTINADNVKTLALKWAFALPGTSEMRSQPVATPIRSLSAHRVDTCLLSIVLRAA